MYNQYGQERMQPSLDLVNRVQERSFETILDVGCGTGTSTAALAAAWPPGQQLKLPGWIDPLRCW